MEFKHKLLKSVVMLLASSSFFLSATEIQPSTSVADVNTESVAPLITEPVTKQPETKQPATALDILLKLQDAFQRSNYELTYVINKQGIIEPVRLIHGFANQQQLAHKVYLNGPTSEQVLRGDTVAFFDSGQQPYSLKIDSLDSPFARLIKSDWETLQQNYQLIIAGNNREAGRAAQVIRVIPKSPFLYGMYVWVDLETQLPLRIDVVDGKGQLLEQTMVVGLNQYQELSPWLQELSKIELPAVVSRDVALTEQKEKLNWTVTWLPEGMVLVRDQQHRLPMLDEAVDYLRYNDGLYDISIYANIREMNSKSSTQLANQGVTNLHSVTQKNIEITVVGDVPAETLSKIIDGIKIQPIHIPVGKVSE